MTALSWDNVLLLQTSFLGDTVLTLPLIAELRRRFPVKKLTLLCQPASRELLQDHPAIDELIIDDKKRADRGWTGLRAKAASLRAKRFTLAITPHKSLRSALLLCWAGIPCRIGFRQSAGWFLYHRRVARDPQRHDVERNLSVLEAFGVRIEDCERALDLPVSAALQESVNHKLRALGVADDQMVVGVNPGSVWPTKRWSAAGFAELILMLKKSSIARSCFSAATKMLLWSKTCRLAVRRPLSIWWGGSVCASWLRQSAAVRYLLPMTAGRCTWRWREGYRPWRYFARRRPSSAFSLIWRMRLLSAGSSPADPALPTVGGAVRWVMRIVFTRSVRKKYWRACNGSGRATGADSTHPSRLFSRNS